jgi:hypothetical protein
MNIVDLSNHQFANNRDLFRKELVGIFLNETPGTGRGLYTSKYQYVVKRISGHEVSLNRPARFNNGFDFTLSVSNINFNTGGRASTRPKHQNIFDDLLLKKTENLVLYTSLIAEITNIYNCASPIRLTFPFTSGYSTEIILECIKWLFAEQDITYWNNSGRAMFYNGILAV